MRALIPIAVCAGCLIPVHISSAAEPTATIEFRRAMLTPTPGYTRIATSDSQPPLYVADEVELTNADIAEAKVGLDSRGAYAIDLTMTEEGGKKLRKFTEGHLLKPMAILVDGKLLSAPRIQSAISSKAQISGNFDKTEAHRLAAVILGKPAP